MDKDAKKCPGCSCLNQEQFIKHIDEQGNIEMEGYLEKMSSWEAEKEGFGFFGISKWKKRWFVVAGHTMSYYYNQNDKVVRASVDLQKVKLEAPSTNGDPREFKLQNCNSGKFMSIRATSGEAATEWFNCLLGHQINNELPILN